MRSQSHKCGCLCATNSDRRFHGFGVACGHMWVSTTRDSIRFREKSIVKLLFYHSEFVALRIV